MKLTCYGLIFAGGILVGIAIIQFCHLHYTGDLTLGNVLSAIVTLALAFTVSFLWRNKHYGEDHKIEFIASRTENFLTETQEFHTEISNFLTNKWDQKKWEHILNRFRQLSNLMLENEDLSQVFCQETKNQSGEEKKIKNLFTDSRTHLTNYKKEVTSCVPSKTPDFDDIAEINKIYRSLRISLMSVIKTLHERKVKFK
jgi:hypothetical protein